MLKLKVLSCNPSNGGKTFVTKLAVPTVTKVTALGVKTKKETLYSSSPSKFEIGAEIDVDMSDFKVVEHPFTTEDGETINLKWLHLK